MNRLGIWKSVRPFHKLSITTYEKKKGPSIIKKELLSKNVRTIPSGECNVKKALQFMRSSSLSNSKDLGRKYIRYGKEKPNWQIQKDALKKKFQGGQWNPPKRLPRQEMESIRLLKSQFPAMSASDLASHFKISPEAVRRILKAKWTPKEDDMANIESRWSRRGERIKAMYEERRGTPLSEEQPDEVITLRYNPSGVSQDYYTKKRPSTQDFKYSKRHPQSSKQSNTTHNKLHLLHKIKD
ncbi:required for respiratory growth protein 9, mitochondrial [Monosporozyma unispora]